MSEVVRGFGAVLAAAPRLAAVYRRHRLDPTLREKLMLAVSEVNACRACTWAHSRWAIREGVAPEELDQLLSPAHADHRQRVALAYAIARAEAGIHAAPPPELERSVAAAFSSAERRDIDALLSVVINANLASNTIEAHTPAGVHGAIRSFLRRASPARGGRRTPEAGLSHLLRRSPQPLDTVGGSSRQGS